MKKFLPLLLLLPLAGCEQKKPPTPEGRAKAAARTATGTVLTKLEVKTQPDPILNGGVTIGDFKIFKKKDTPEGFREEWETFKPLPDTDSDTVSTVLMRAWLVEKNGSYMESLRPAYKGYGSFVTDFLPPRPGYYILWFEYQPQDKDNPSRPMPQELARKEIVVKGSVGPANVLVAPGGNVAYVYKRQAKGTGAKVEVKAGTFQIGKLTDLSWTLAGKNPEKSEMIALSPDGQDLLRFVGNKKAIELTQPGVWRLWFGFEQNGERYYAPYAVSVKP
jgi:hypothetical protein